MKAILNAIGDVFEAALDIRPHAAYKSYISDEIQKKHEHILVNEDEFMRLQTAITNFKEVSEKDA